MRILYLTQYFPPEMGAPQVRIPELMRHMTLRGHEVTVVTAMPNYPAARVFPGYRWRLVKTEEYETMRVVRSWIYPTRSVGFVKRTASQLSFALSSALLAPWFVGKQDIILAGSPPLFIALSAMILGRTCRCRYIAVVADLWPEIAIETGVLKSRLGIRLATWLESTLYQRALAVVTQTEGQADNIRMRYPGATVHVISGGVDTGLFSPELRSEAIRREFGIKDRVGVLYAGLLGFAQGLEVVLDVASRLRHRMDIQFTLIGDGMAKDDLVRRAREMALPNLAFRDAVERERLPAVLASMDMALITLRRGVPKATIPSKLYEAMASGVAVVVGADGEVNDLVRDAKIGLTAGAGDAEGLRAAIERLADDRNSREEFGATGLRLARSRYDRKQIGARLHEMLTGLV